MRLVLAAGVEWFSGGLNFGCTECGRCCKMDGDVWLAPEEVSALAAHLQLEEPEFRAAYTRQQIRDWACLKQSASAPGRGCVFFDGASNQCGIYEQRPIQCSTYPFWPSLLGSEEDWEEEAVAPDDHPDPQARRWSLETGGCEGIRPDAPLVDAATIRQKRDAARRHWRRFPGFFIKRNTWYL
jgi:Fe-S-cluster containining protein